MASFVLRPVFRPHAVGIGIGLSLAASTAAFCQRPLRLDATPVTLLDSSRRARHGQLNPRAVRQISSGSVIGLCAGLAVSTFSRPLALLLGLLIVGIQWAASHGLDVLPYEKLQRYVTSINLRSTLQNDMPFKLSFGLTFTMAAFMRF